MYPLVIDRPPLMAELPNVRLHLSNTPENVVLVREMLTGIAENIDLNLQGSDLNDIRTAVTEACNNVVLHAYEGKEGPLEVEVYLTASAFEVVVRDRGTGIPPRVAGVRDVSPGIGLPIIRALVHRVHFDAAADKGTEVRMEFATATRRQFEPLAEDDFELFQLPRAELTATAALAIAPARLAQTVLPRVLSVLAARAHFSTDRIADAQILADALVAQVDGSRGGDHLTIAVTVKPRSLELHLGPLGAGYAQGLIVDSYVPGLGEVIQKLIDHHQVAFVGTSEVLTLGLIDRG